MTTFMSGVKSEKIKEDKSSPVDDIIIGKIISIVTIKNIFHKQIFVMVLPLIFIIYYIGSLLLSIFNARNGRKPIAKCIKYRKQDPETRYDSDGTRYQCLALPYRIINGSVEILMITSRKRGDYIFPGGGWEKNENGAQCAQREAFEEAGIYGNITKQIVSNQYFISDKGNKSRIWGYLLNVTNVLNEWPEYQRCRKWMKINEAEMALSEKRRVKYGLLWKHGIKYFVERNLYSS